MLRFLLWISCSFFLVTNLYAETTSCTKHQCIAVVDAGSTGSRLHIFAYDLDPTNTPIDITEIWLQKSNPGFATLETNQNTIDNYLSTLFAGAPVQNIPVYFYATGGMRLLPQSKQKFYYQSLQNWFNQQTGWDLKESKTIKGDDEALYDWLALNYHLGTLTTAAKHSVGVMDIGGASVQIAFPMQKNATSNKETQIELDLYGQHINLFVHSFLGLGQTEVSHHLLNTNSCFANNYPLPDGESGQGNATECVQEVASLINGVHKTNTVVQSTLASNPVSTWYAMGGVAYLAESKPFQFPNQQLTTQDLLQQANNFVCHQSWDEMSTQYPNNEYIDNFCLLPAFYYALLVDGYGISPNKAVHYVPTTQNLDWTLGVVLHH